ncbi:hypothetical protein GCM10027059_49290 [Myceligenerans halotolerans]
MLAAAAGASPDGAPGTDTSARAAANPSARLAMDFLILRSCSVCQGVADVGRARRAAPSARCDHHGGRWNRLSELTM